MNSIAGLPCFVLQILVIHIHHCNLHFSTHTCRTLVVPTAAWTEKRRVHARRRCIAVSTGRDDGN